MAARPANASESPADSLKFLTPWRGIDSECGIVRPSPKWGPRNRPKLTQSAGAALAAAAQRADGQNEPGPGFQPGIGDHPDPHAMAALFERDQDGALVQHGGQGPA